MSMHDAPLNRTRIKRIYRNPVLRALVLITLILPFMAPLLFSAGWHATHSSIQRYDNYKIRVPWPYVLFKRGDHALLIKIRTVLHWHFYKFAVIDITPRNEPLDINIWKEQLIQAYRKHGENLSGSFRISMSNIQVACIQVTKNYSEMKYFVVCRSEDGTTIEYFGDGNGLRQMKNLLSGITPIRK